MIADIINLSYPLPLYAIKILLFNLCKNKSFNFSGSFTIDLTCIPSIEKHTNQSKANTSKSKKQNGDCLLTPYENMFSGI